MKIKDKRSKIKDKSKNPLLGVVGVGSKNRMESI